MSKLNKFAGAQTLTAAQVAARKAALTSTVATPSATPDTRTALGGEGWTRTPYGELYLTAIGAFITAGKHHENATSRVARVGKLARAIALEEDGVQWLTDMVRYARTVGNIRDSGIVIAVEATAARVEAGLIAGTRHLVNAACGRADEPGKLLTMWIVRYGQDMPEEETVRPGGVFPRVPNALKRGLADAVIRLYDEYSLLRYDTPSADRRFGDVIQLVRPRAESSAQSQLFKWAMERARTGWKDGARRLPGRMLQMIRARRELEAVPLAARRALVSERVGVPFSQRLKDAGASWEWVSGWLADGEGMTAEVWEALAPNMGYMALLRNLRNFDQAGISADAANAVATRLADPAQVAKSRQFPFRFLAAYRASSDSLRWGLALEQALSASLSNVPVLKGRTLICIDRSPSMFPGYHFSTSSDSEISLADQAAVFGCALALRAENATVVVYGGTSRVVEVPKGAALLKFVDGLGGAIDYTDTKGAVRSHFSGHDRVIVVTDEQSSTADASAPVPANVPVYVWNMAGYGAGNMASGVNNRHTFGGLTDDSFRMVTVLEEGLSTGWPWESQRDGK